MAWSGRKGRAKPRGCGQIEALASRYAPNIPTKRSGVVDWLVGGGRAKRQQVSPPMGGPIGKRVVQADYNGSSPERKVEVVRLIL